MGEKISTSMSAAQTLRFEVTVDHETEHNLITAFLQVEDFLHLWSGPEKIC